MAEYAIHRDIRKAAFCCCVDGATKSTCRSGSWIICAVGACCWIPLQPQAYVVVGESGWMLYIYYGGFLCWLLRCGALRAYINDQISYDCIVALYLVTSSWFFPTNAGRGRSQAAREGPTGYLLRDDSRDTNNNILRVHYFG